MIEKNPEIEVKTLGVSLESHNLLRQAKRNATHRGVSLGSLADEAIVAAYGKPAAEAPKVEREGL
jgi:hypothetical protein